MADGGGDTCGIINLETWNATDTSVLSYAKTPFQNTNFTNNSDAIGRALRQSILYFADTINDVDRPFCVLGNECRSTRTHRYQVPRASDDASSDTVTLEITNFAPIAFEHLRSIIGITRAEFYKSFQQGELLNFVNTGRSGSQMYKTSDDVYIIKTLRDHEAKLLLQSLPGLYLRYAHHSTLMTRYTGLYSVNVRGVFATEIFCVIMINNLPLVMDIHELFDLKGSSVGRISSIDLPVRRLKALKDLDFESFYPFGIRIPHDIYRRLRQTIESDVDELRKLMITDFSLMLGVYHLDDPHLEEEDGEKSIRMKPRPQLGISSLFAATNINPAAVLSNNNTQSIDKDDVSTQKTIDRFIMKPLRLISCALEETFAGNKEAESLLGIPGLTHDGRRVLLYPTFIDCLQTFDNFKRIQTVIQNLRDPKRSGEYSVIPSDEYGKRMLNVLFDRILIDSNQTLDELLASPVVCQSLPARLESRSSIDESEERDAGRESFEIINVTKGLPFPKIETHVIQTTDVIQNLAAQPLPTSENVHLVNDSTRF